MQLSVSREIQLGSIYGDEQKPPRCLERQFRWSVIHLCPSWTLMRGNPGCDPTPSSCGVLHPSSAQSDLHDCITGNGYGGACLLKSLLFSHEVNGGQLR